MSFALTAGAARQPRLRVAVNGGPMTGVTDIGVAASAHFSADRFYVRAAIDPQTLQTANWIASNAILIDIQVDLANLTSGIGWTSLITGYADTVELDPIAGTLRLNGRDLSASLIAAQMQETFSNRTASEVAVLLASRHGLTASVTATTTPVGRYYQIEHDRITLAQFSQATTEWDLLAWLAEREGFYVWVAGTTLYFQPPSVVGGPTTIATEMLSELRLERAVTLARPVEVTVKSWNSRQQTAFSETASANVEADGVAARYVLVRPNLTPGEAMAVAERRLADITQHAYSLAATMPGDTLLMPRNQLALIGTGTDFDQIYTIATIERRLAAAGGFTQRLQAITAGGGG